MNPVTFGLMAVITTLCFVVGVLLLSVYGDQVMEIESRWLRILTRFSIIFGWPAWMVVAFVALVWTGVVAAFESLFK